MGQQQSSMSQPSGTPSGYDDIRSPPCQCTAAGHCTRTNRDVSDHQILLCQTNAAGYRDYWDAKIAGVPERAKPGSLPLAPIVAGGLPLVAANNSECLHRRNVARKIKCGSCKGSVRVKIFACEIKGECTLARAIDGIACCATCEDFAAAEVAAKTDPRKACEADRQEAIE